MCIRDRVNVFHKLTDLGITGEWDIITSDDKDGAELLYDPEWIQNQLKEGHPIIVGWNSYGAHYQTIKMCIRDSILAITSLIVHSGVEAPAATPILLHF